MSPRFLLQMGIWLSSIGLPPCKLPWGMASTLLCHAAACRTHSDVLHPAAADIIAQFVFGYGVGGEYPMAAGSAAERAETGGKEAARHRGRAVVLTFSMQVWLFGSAASCSSRMPFSH